MPLSLFLSFPLSLSPLSLFPSLSPATPPWRQIFAADPAKLYASTPIYKKQVQEAAATPRPLVYTISGAGLLYISMLFPPAHPRVPGPYPWALPASRTHARRPAGRV
jgi:hypothetical protein